MKIVLFVLISFPLFSQKFTTEEIARWKQTAGEVTITRDTWGIPHVSGTTDAQAVFGLLYAQCEDDFVRVERNYISALGRLAEIEGESFIYNDLRIRLFNDTLKAISIYANSPAWMKKLCQGFADGINYYLYTHQNVRPRLLKRFQPWMPLLFSEGSIGGNIETIDLKYLKEFYGNVAYRRLEETKGEPEPKGSNGFAIAPARSATGHALLLINPHTSFYFRSEVHVTSKEGLNAYGAVTWGQFFVYQGFNEHCGWMHTTSGADVIDYYQETIIKKGDKLFYKHGTIDKPVSSQKVSIFYKKGTSRARKDFVIYKTHHGPIVDKYQGKWVSVSLMQEPLRALTQSYQRTKSTSLEEFKNTMMLRTNSSNNTVYADAKGNIAYWHGDFIPRRDAKFDWGWPVDGSNPETDWKDLHTIDEIVHIENPASGWIQNCNSTPFTVAGESSPKKSDYPTYMAPDDENERGIHAVRVLKDASAITLEKLITLSQDPYLPAFETMIPGLIDAYDQLSATNDTLRTRYAEPIDILRAWDYRYAVPSVATTLGIYWAQRLRQNVESKIPEGTGQLGTIQFMSSKVTGAEKMKSFAQAVKELERDFGTWKQPWGEVNRFQRLSGKVEAGFDDQKPSFAVASTSSFYGSLAAFGSRKYPNTKKMYGNVGNSFVAVVEFGPKVRAKSVVTGGASSDPDSPHFSDQSILYAQGQFKEVWFYSEDIQKHIERSYHPGE